MATCRSCGAEIIFAETEKGHRMPIDAQAVLDGTGNVKLVQRGGTLMAVVVNVGQGTHVSHFKTCPQAAQHRRSR